MLTQMYVGGAMARTHDRASSKQAYLADVPVSCSQVHTEPPDSFGGSIILRGCQSADRGRPASNDPSPRVYRRIRLTPRSLRERQRPYTKNGPESRTAFGICPS